MTRGPFDHSIASALHFRTQAAKGPRVAIGFERRPMALPAPAPSSGRNNSRASDRESIGTTLVEDDGAGVGTRPPATAPGAAAGAALAASSSRDAAPRARTERASSSARSGRSACWMLSPHPSSAKAATRRTLAMGYRGVGAAADSGDGDDDGTGGEAFGALPSPFATCS